MHKTYFSFVLLFAGILALNFTSCVKENFDEPPPYEYPTLETNGTIADIKAYHVPGQFVTIDKELIVDAIVIANDSSGNYFKTLIVQDETGGIELKINDIGLFSQFPVGRRIYMNCKGLVISDYNNLVQLGGGTYEDDEGNLRLGGIEDILIEKYIVKGAPNQDIEPQVVNSFNELSLDDQSTLVKLTNVQFITSDTSSTYADEDERRALNLTIENCAGDKMTLRTSGYADFADVNVPDGSGTITGIFSVFGTSQQIFIRKAADAQLKGDRCNSTGGCNFSEELITIQDLRELYSGSSTTGPDGKKIKGVVISDRTKGNIQERNLVLEGENGYGILVRFQDIHSYNLGDEIVVLTGGTELSEFKGLLQLSDVSNARTCSSGQGTLPEPTVLVVDDLLNDFERYESTLVKILDANINGGGGKYSGNTTVSDATGSIPMFTRSEASFAAQDYPDGDVNITAIASQFNDPQLNIRSAQDVESVGGGGGGGTAGIPFTEEFDQGIPSDWSLIATTGDRVWEGRDFDGEFYVQMSAFSSSEGVLDITTWMITPEFNMEKQTGETIELKLADAFENGNPFKLMYSDDYDGGDPGKATWTEIGHDVITPLINNPQSYDNIYESTGKIDVSGLSGKVRFAFLYESGGTISTTIQLSTVIIK